MVEVLKNKQVVSFICSIHNINNELSLISAEKGFKFKELKNKIAQDVCDPWDKFFEVLQIEKDKLARDSQRAFEWAMIKFEGLSGSCPTKIPWKEEIKVKKKE
jgi:hypothetical protein